MRHILSINEFLNESKQVGVLYHFTTPRGLRGILEYDEMRSANNFISFTRNFNLEQWATTHGAYCRISMDGDKLSSRYRLSPYLYDPADDEVSGSGEHLDVETRRKKYGDEREEKVLTPIIDKIHKYIIQVDIIKYPMKSNEKTTIQKVEDAHPDVNFNYVEHFRPVKHVLVTA
jgi:hypothetical protein